MAPTTTAGRDSVSSASSQKGRAGRGHHEREQEREELERQATTTSTTASSAGDTDTQSRHTGSVGSRRSSLLSKTITSKRRSKRGRTHARKDDEPEQQHHHLHLHSILHSGDGSGVDDGRVSVSKTNRDDDDSSTRPRQTAASNRMEDQEASFPGTDPDSYSRKPQSSHVSTSSPLVQAGHIPQVITTDHDDSDRSSRASTFPPETAYSTDPVVVAPSSKTGLAPPQNKSRRSVSPAGRFRDVFRSKKSPAASLKSTNSSQSPERKPAQLQFPQDDELIDPKTPSPDSTPNSNSKLPAIITTSPASSAATAAFPSPPPAAVVIGEPASTSDSRPSRGHAHSHSLDTSLRPQTPTNSDNGPVIVNTPPTPTDPSYPRLPHHSRLPSSPEFATPASAANAPQHLHHYTHASSPLSTASSSMTSPRRARAGSASLGPSKLSSTSSFSASLSPTPENGPTASSSPSTTGFFSSVISVAQNATNSISNSITNTNISAPWNSSGSSNKKTSITNGSSRDLGSVGDSQSAGGSDDRTEVESGVPKDPAEPSDTKELAVKTLGMGDLSLSQLGIVDPPKNSAVVSVTAAPPALGITTSPTMPTQLKVVELANESRRRSESAPADSPYHTVGATPYDHNAADDMSVGRAPSLAETTVIHDIATTPAASVNEDRLDAIQRAGSVRSALDRRRKRGSSAATGGTATTIAAAIAAANASVAHPTHSNTPKLTGFAVASKKRNRDFHNLFKSVPDDDYLIEDYSCALQREILAHGRLYVSEGHLCFSSNIMGWSTTLVMSFDEIVSVEKRSTALIFKNGLMISTLHAKHIFASFASRDSTYDLIVKIWKMGHPSLQSSLNGVHIDETGGDKTEKIGAGEDLSLASRSDSASDSESDDSEEVYDEDAEDDDVHDAATAADSAVGGDTDGEKSIMRKPSGAGVAAAGADKPAKDSPSTPGGDDFPGPQTHAPTECGDAAEHYDKILADETVPAPLGKTFSLIFGASSAAFMTKFLSNDQNKCFDIAMTDKKGLSTDARSRTYTYMKPLFAPIGPKQTKCIVTEQIEFVDFEKSVTVVCSTKSPDVPNGNIFVTKTRYCLSWGENNSTRIQANCTIEWSGKSWIKVAIEKGANEGQTAYLRDIVASLKEAISARPRSNTVTGASKGRKRNRKGKTATTTGPTSTDGPAKPSAKSDWGPLEPLHSILSPAVGLVKPLLTSNIMYGLLLGLVVAAWFGSGVTNRQAQRGGFGQELKYGAGYAGYPDRMAAYEEMWRREESELWDWLEARVGMDRVTGGNVGSSKGLGDPQPRKRVMEPRTVEEKMREERMDDREIREAIKVTEEKLKVLKSVVEARRD